VRIHVFSFREKYASWFKKRAYVMVRNDVSIQELWKLLDFKDLGDFHYEKMIDLEEQNSYIALPDTKEAMKQLEGKGYYFIMAEIPKSPTSSTKNPISSTSKLTEEIIIEKLDQIIKLLEEVKINTVIPFQPGG